MTPTSTPRSALSHRQRVKCSRHPEAVAGWTCAGCGPLCPACVARVRVDARVQYDTCAACDAHVPQLRVPGSTAAFPLLLRSHLFGKPSLRLLYGSVAALFWGELTLNVERGAHGVGAWVLTALAAAVLGVAFCALAVDTARGPDELVRSESLELLSEAVRPSWPVSALFFLLLIEPVLLPSRTGVGADRWIWNAQAVIVSGGIGALLPWTSVRQALAAQRGRLSRSARPSPGILGIGAGAGVLMHLFLWTSAASAQESLWGWAEPVRVLVVFFALALARVTGLWLHANATALGYALPERYQVPILGDAVPTGAPAPKVPAAPARSYAPIEM